MKNIVKNVSTTSLLILFIALSITACGNRFYSGAPSYHDDYENGYDTHYSSSDVTTEVVVTKTEHYGSKSTLVVTYNEDDKPCVYDESEGTTYCGEDVEDVVVDDDDSAVVIQNKEGDIIKEMASTTDHSGRTYTQINNYGEIVFDGGDVADKQADRASSSDDAFKAEGVQLRCYGKDPFIDTPFKQNDYLSSIETPATVAFLMNMSNIVDRDIDGFSEEGVIHYMMRNARIAMTISNVNVVDGKKVFQPTKTIEMVQPFPVNIRRISYSEYYFEIQLSPVFLQDNEFHEGLYSFTDVWLTYHDRSNDKMKVSGACPKYNFIVGSLPETSENNDDAAGNEDLADTVSSESVPHASEEKSETSENSLAQVSSENAE